MSPPAFMAVAMTLAFAVLAALGFAAHLCYRKEREP